MTVNLYRVKTALIDGVKHEKYVYLDVVFEIGKWLPIFYQLKQKNKVSKGLEKFQFKVVPVLSGEIFPHKAAGVDMCLNAADKQWTEFIEAIERPAGEFRQLI